MYSLGRYTATGIHRQLLDKIMAIKCGVIFVVCKHAGGITNLKRLDIGTGGQTLRKAQIYNTQHTHYKMPKIRKNFLHWIGHFAMRENFVRHASILFEL